MSAEQGVDREYCNLRSNGLEHLQQRAEQRLDSHSQKLDDLTAACIGLTAAVDRVSLLLEKQDQRLDRVENRSLSSFLGTAGGKALLRFGGIFLLVLLSAAVGVNVIQLIKEVLS